MKINELRRKKEVCAVKAAQTTKKASGKNLMLFLKN
jgi:hypothetical protein